MTRTFVDSGSPGMSMKEFGVFVPINFLCANGLCSYQFLRFASFWVRLTSSRFYPVPMHHFWLSNQKQENPYVLTSKINHMFSTPSGVETMMLQGHSDTAEHSAIESSTCSTCPDAPRARGVPLRLRLKKGTEPSCNSHMIWGFLVPFKCLKGGPLNSWMVYNGKSYTK